MGYFRPAPVDHRGGKPGSLPVFGGFSCQRLDLLYRFPGCSARNDVEHLVRKYGAMGRIHFLHLRNVKLLPDGSFEESGHYSSCGSLDMVRLLKACHEVGFHGYLRPDHGRMIWGETGKPGYGLYDRALGAMYLAGIWEALSNP